MLEIDNVWSKMIDEAALNAAETGRHAVADYLRLRATNDAIRRAGIAWLFDTLTEVAAEAAVVRTGISITRHEPHNFARGNSNMVGSMIEIRQGVRCLTVEAGWARTPKDGIMLDGALAFARISHFGMPRSEAELRLKLPGDAEFPRWLSRDGQSVDSSELIRHFQIFAG